MKNARHYSRHGHAHFSLAKGAGFGPNGEHKKRLSEGYLLLFIVFLFATWYLLLLMLVLLIGKAKSREEALKVASNSKALLLKQIQFAKDKYRGLDSSYWPTAVLTIFAVKLSKLADSRRVF